MCNIAGYVGTRQAAPILVEMLKKQEGLAGGYYTGIVTCHEGKFYTYKLTGDTDYLLSQHDVLSMPGNIGIIHSRSKSGGGDEWAHPFAGYDPEGHVLNYYVANGTAGIYKDRKAETDALARELEDEGYRFDSKIRLDDDTRYQTLSDGSKVHTSDVMAQLIARNMYHGMTAAAAMEKGFCDMPTELVGLMLASHTPGGIVYSATNFPMCAARCDHGMYLASAAAAFPEDARFEQQLPPHTSGYVYKDRFEVIPYAQPLEPMDEMDARAVHAVYKIIENELKSGEKSCKELKAAARAAFRTRLTPVVRTVYEVLYAMKQENLIDMHDVRVDGVYPHLTAPRTMISLKK